MMVTFGNINADQQAALADAADWFARVFTYPDGASTDRKGAPEWAAPAMVLHYLPNADQLWNRREGVVYCGLFDIGSPEPAAPMQESFYHSDPHMRLRRVSSFYRYFDITHFSQWAPDHLCVELTFLAYLLRLSAAHSTRDDLARAVPAFALLHPGSFVYAFAQRVLKADNGGIYVAIVTALCRFLEGFGNEQRILTARH